MNENQDYTISEDYCLPSMGKIYDKPFDPHVKIRSMTTREEMRRTSPSSTPYKNMADIIDACLITKLPLSSYDLCVGDYEYLLHKLRVVSYGPEYKMSVTCPICKNRETITLNLDDLKVNPYNDKETKDLLSITLPVSGKLISLRYQTPRMLDNIILKKEDYNSHNKSTSIDPTFALTLQAVIDTVDGVKLKSIELENFVDNLKIKDSKAIMKNVHALSEKVALDSGFDYTCSHCHYRMTTFFRFGPEFFEPTD